MYQIKNVCSLLNDRVLPYRNVKVSKAQHTIHANYTCVNSKHDKPWIEEIWKNKTNKNKTENTKGYSIHKVINKHMKITNKKIDGKCKL